MAELKPQDQYDDNFKTYYPPSAGLYGTNVSQGSPDPLGSYKEQLRKQQPAGDPMKVRQGIIQAGEQARASYDKRQVSKQQMIDAVSSAQSLKGGIMGSITPGGGLQRMVFGGTPTEAAREMITGKDTTPGTNLFQNIAKFPEALAGQFAEGFKKAGEGVVDMIGGALQAAPLALKDVATLGQGLSQEERDTLKNAQRDFFQGGVDTMSGTFQSVYSPISAGIAAAPDEAQQALGSVVGNVTGAINGWAENMGIDTESEDWKYFGDNMINLFTVASLGLAGQTTKAARAGKAPVATTTQRAVNGLRKVAYNINSKFGQYFDDLTKNIAKAKPAELTKAIKETNLRASKGLGVSDDISRGVARPNTLTQQVRDLATNRFKDIDDIIKSNPADDAARIIANKTGLSIDDAKLVMDVPKKARTQFMKQFEIAAKNEGARGAVVRPLSVPGKNITGVAGDLVKKMKEFGKAKGKLISQNATKKVNLNPVKAQFADDAARYGVKVGKGGKLDFTGNLVRGDADLRAAFKLIADNLDDAGKATVQNVDDMRAALRGISESTKNVKGLTSNAKRIVDSYRASLGKSLEKTLGSQYMGLNTKYAKGIEASKGIAKYLGLDDLQFDKMDDISRLGAELRGGEVASRLLGNASARPYTELNKLFKTAQELGVKNANFNTVMHQVKMADLLDDLFGSTQTRGFQGGIERGVEAVKQGKEGIINRAVEGAWNKATGRGIQSQREAVKTMLQSGRVTGQAATRSAGPLQKVGQALKAAPGKIAETTKQVTQATLQNAQRASSLLDDMLKTPIAVPQMLDAGLALTAGGMAQGIRRQGDVREGVFNTEEQTQRQSATEAYEDFYDQTRVQDIERALEKSKIKKEEINVFKKFAQGQNLENILSQFSNDETPEVVSKVIGATLKESMNEEDFLRNMLALADAKNMSTTNTK